MLEATGSISRPPTPGELFFDRAFRATTRTIAWLTIGLVFFLFVEMAITASPAIKDHGLSFLTTDRWDPGRNQYGIVPQIGGTL